MNASLSHSWLTQGRSCVNEYGSTDERCRVSSQSKPKRTCPHRSGSVRVAESSTVSRASHGVHICQRNSTDPLGPEDRGRFEMAVTGEVLVMAPGSRQPAKRSGWRVARFVCEPESWIGGPRTGGASRVSRVPPSAEDRLAATRSLDSGSSAGLVHDPG